MKKRVIIISALSISLAAAILLSVGADLTHSFTGDGNILRRSQEETCHGCHKTDQNAPADANAIKTHSSAATGSSKWGAGGWGITGGKYGKFVCTTCHSAHRTSNIYLINETISTADGSNWATTGTATVASVFKKKTLAGSPNPGVSDGVMGDDTGGHTSSARVCEVCHSLTKYHRYNTAGQTALDHYNGNDCTQCHSHKNGFAHGGPGGTGCQNCHGHEDDWPVVPGYTWHGTKQSHATHTENDADDLRGPRITCADCHDTNNFPRFKDGQDLAGTTVCNLCHSPGGPFDGVNDPVIGAKNNWQNGVYTGTSLTAGKEKWCVGCHDSGVSVIGGRQAPDIAGNNSTYGYYISGHGGAGQECGACHGLDMNHNFDGKRTYASASNNYQAGYRLKNIGGLAPMRIPAANDGWTYTSGDFRLCYSCHSETDLLSDKRASGVFGGTTNPFKNSSSISTGFRNEDSVNGYYWAGGVPANIHADHLMDVNQSWVGSPYWDSDRDNINDSKTTCITCHNPHSDSLTDGATATKAMTVKKLDIRWGTDATPYHDYGQIGPNANWTVCFGACHGGSGFKYYRTSPVPLLNGVSAADANPADPAPAEAGFTNNRTVQMTFSVGGGRRDADDPR